MSAGQSARAPAGRQQQVLDYASQLWALLPLQAAATALHFTGLRMRAMADALDRGVRAGDLSALAEVEASPRRRLAAQLARWLRG